MTENADKMDTSGQGYAIELLDYELPQEMIAQEPLSERCASRMLHLARATGEIAHRRFTDLAAILRKGDVLVINDSRVIPGRIRGRKLTGGAVEIVVLKELPDRCFEVLSEVRGGMKTGDKYLLLNDFLVEVLEAKNRGLGTVRVIEMLPDGYSANDFKLDDLVEADNLSDDEFMAKFYRNGEMPVPPYIKRQPKSPERYQTVYAVHRGSAAAPTAGLHFTREFIDKLEASGIDVIEMTLHVGIGTFLPVRVDDLSRHRMHAEEYSVTRDAAVEIARAKADGRRIIAVGTTSARTLETVFAPDNLDGDGTPVKLSGESELFIYPGYEWKIVDAMLTNFHLPRSTLLAMIFAFAGREVSLRAYESAISERYRFYSFGDCMFIE